MDDLAAAEATERELREQIAELVHARARAEQEGRRVSERATLAGADASLEGIAERWKRQTGVLDGEIESCRTSLRAAEAEVARLRADAAGA
jgi:chromosome segregation ATPase